MENQHQLRIKPTSDGLDTLYNEYYNQFYHSVLGATNETQRVYIELGLQYAFTRFADVNLLEIGFGMGFGAWLTAIEATKNQKKVIYTGIEPHPIPVDALAATQLSSAFLDNAVGCSFLDLNRFAWEEEININKYFVFQKFKTTVQAFESEKKYNLIYFDAFAPSSQPELWSTTIFKKLANLLTKGGVLTTYCSKGEVQRNLQAAGFRVEKHPGPPRKREVLRAILEK